MREKKKQNRKPRAEKDLVSMVIKEVLAEDSIKVQKRKK
jgi:hypothetical protein